MYSNYQQKNSISSKVIPIVVIGTFLVVSFFGIAKNTLADNSSTPSGDTTPRIMYWYGKVNQHVDASGVCQTDPDGDSGANIDRLTYCKKWFPDTTSIEDYKPESIGTWQDAGNVQSSEYPSSFYYTSAMSYKCVQNGVVVMNPPSIAVVSPNGGNIYAIGQDINLTWESNNIPETDNMQIGLVQDETNLYYALADFSLNYGSATFTIDPYTQPGKYKIKIKDTSAGVEDFSDHSFTIGPVSSPIPDTTLPVITLLGDSSISIDIGSVFVDPGITATDDVDGDVASKVVMVNPVDINVAGTYTITYDVTDVAGNHALQVSRQVVVNNIPVVINSVPTRGGGGGGGRPPSPAEVSAPAPSTSSSTITTPATIPSVIIPPTITTNENSSTNPNLVNGNYVVNTTPVAQEVGVPLIENHEIPNVVSKSEIENIKVTKKEKEERLQLTQDYGVLLEAASIKAADYELIKNNFIWIELALLATFITYFFSGIWRQENIKPRRKLGTKI